MKFWKLASAVTALVLSTSVNAALITQGALTTNDDGSTNIITDTLNSYEWLRFDVLPRTTYAQTVSILDTVEGGGWNIAGTTQAVQFIDALFADSSHICTTTSAYGTSCGLLNGWTDGILGNTHDSNFDFGMYIDDDGRVGLVRTQATGDVRIFNSWSTIGVADDYSTDMEFIVYRSISTSTVPIPAAVWLFGSGLIGLVGFARRKKA